MYPGPVIVSLVGLVTVTVTTVPAGPVGEGLVLDSVPDGLVFGPVGEVLVLDSDGLVAGPVGVVITLVPEVKVTVVVYPEPVIVWTVGLVTVTVTTEPPGLDGPVA